MYGQGHGVTCSRCEALTIKSSTFKNLVANEAPAIYIHEQTGIQTNIQDCTFDSNLALGFAGSISLLNAGIVYLSGNKFVNNSVTDESDPITDWRNCDAGAVYYSCPSSDCDVILDGNEFKENFAKNKGGALRYIHKNFTTVFQDDQSESGRRLFSDHHRVL